jgi:hypothetical protein
MRKHIILLLLSIITTLTIKGQDINTLMDGYDNKFALEHMELFTKEEHNSNSLGLLSFHRSIRIVNVDTGWLQNITSLIKQDHTIMYPYLETSSKNLAAYILLANIFDIDMPPTGSGSAIFRELVILNILKNFVKPEDIQSYSVNNSIPAGEDPFNHMINARWGGIAIPSGANERIKAAI